MNYAVGANRIFPAWSSRIAPRVCGRYHSPGESSRLSVVGPHRRRIHRTTDLRLPRRSGRERGDLVTPPTRRTAKRLPCATATQGWVHPPRGNYVESPALLYARCHGADGNTATIGGTVYGTATDTDTAATTVCQCRTRSTNSAPGVYIGSGRRSSGWLAS